eukprot:Skav220927  [mRNA]  locus=scaffold3184:69066:70640:+ [translate_table: standard]
MIMDRELRIRVVAENFPVINLVDLPGLVASFSPSGPKFQVAQETRELFERYAERIGGRHSLILGVVSGLDHRDQWHSIDLIEEKKLERQAVGVITKCDRLDKEELDALPTNQTGTLSFLAVAAGQGSEKRKNEDVDQKEREIFGLGQEDLPSLSCIESVRNKIKDRYLQQIYDRWLPNAISKLLRSWAKSAAEFEMLGQQPSARAFSFDDLKKVISDEVARRWKPLEKMLAEKMEAFHAYLRGRGDTKIESWEVYHRDAEKKLEELMKALCEEARESLENETGNTIKKLGRFPSFKARLLNIFQHDLELQIMKKVHFVAFCAANRASALAASKGFLQGVLLQGQGDEKLKTEGMKSHQELISHMLICDDAMEKLEKMGQDHGDLKHIKAKIFKELRSSNIPSGLDGRCQQWLEVRVCLRQASSIAPVFMKAWHFTRLENEIRGGVWVLPVSLFHFSCCCCICGAHNQDAMPKVEVDYANPDACRVLGKHASILSFHSVLVVCSLGNSSRFEHAFGSCAPLCASF